MLSPMPATTSLRREAEPAIRALHCIPTLKIGGAETQLRLLAPRMVAMGAEIAILSRFSSDDERMLTAQGVRCVDLSPYSNHDPRLLFALHRIVREMRPTVVQTWLTQMDILGGMVARAAGVPWIISERSSPPCYPPGLKNSFRRLLGQRALVVANAEHGRGVWPGHPRVSVIGNGVDFAAIDRVRHALSASAAKMDGGRTIVTVSRLVPEKNVGTLIAAMARLKRMVHDARLVVVGDGPERPALEAQAAALGLGDDVRFVGHQQKPLEWIGAADIFASASAFEGHPNSVTEAAALGVPTVLSDIPMHQSLLGSSALYASGKDPESFARQFVRLMADAALHRSLAEGARSAVQRFDVGAIALAYLDLYRRVASDARESK